MAADLLRHRPVLRGKRRGALALDAAAATARGPGRAGVELWGGAHDHLVEGNRIWEIYDSALTNQNSSALVRQYNITYRNNFIRNAEYSFEYWNHPETALTKNIRFVNNTCVDAGGGWAHARPASPCCWANCRCCESRSWLRPRRAGLRSVPGRVPPTPSTWPAGAIGRIPGKRVRAPLPQASDQ